MQPLKKNECPFNIDNFLYRYQYHVGVQRMIRTDQFPWFGTHVIRGLTDKFNHYRVKEYNLHAFRDPHSVFCALMHAY